MTSAPTGTGVPDAVLPAGWQRLHPLSPLLRAARALAVVVVVAVPRAAAARERLVDRWPELLVVVVAVVGGFVSWAVTRWRVQDGVLELDTGLVRRRQLRVPLVRVQAVDVVRPVLARLLGLAELRLVLAGRGGEQARLAYLTEARALETRARLLAAAHGLDEATPEPAERPLWRVDNARLLVATLLAGEGLVGVAALVLLAGSSVALLVAGRPAAATGLFAASVPVALTLGGVGWRRLSGEWGTEVAEAPDGMRVRAGLLQTRAETVPFARLQAVRWTEPLLWRPRGWARVEVDVARQRRRSSGDLGDGGEDAAADRAVLPVGTREEALVVLQRVGAGVSPDALARPPRRARWLAPLSWGRLGVHHDDVVLVTGSGRLARRVVVVPLHKVQSLRLVQGPVARRLGLADVHADLVGRHWAAAALRRDAAEAEELLVRLSDLARDARRRHARG